MIGKTYSIHLVFLVLVLVQPLTCGTAHADQIGRVHLTIIDAFTTTELPVTGGAVINHQQGHEELKLRVYEMDGIQRIEAKLSDGLTADPEQSKQIVLQRFQQLHEEDRARMQRAAMGLAKAMQYGIDRYQEWREGRVR